jgi:hypothetical protein
MRCIVNVRSYAVKGYGHDSMRIVLLRLAGASPNPSQRAKFRQNTCSFVCNTGTLNSRACLVLRPTETVSIQTWLITYIVFI